MSKKEEIQTCAECGASVYPEHIESGKAAVIAERLRCPHCLDDYNKSHHSDEERFEGQSTIRAPGEGEDFTPISVDDEPATGESQIVRSKGGDTLAGANLIADDADLKRPLMPENAGATRSRTFHAKLNDGAVAFMNKHINEFADDNPEIVIKFASSTIGVWEGKKADSHLIVTVFY